MDKETRTFPLSDIEIREKADGGFTFRGYAAVFNAWSEDLGGFREQVDPAAFNRAIGGANDVRHLINHDPNLLLGRTSSGTTELRVDQRGLHVTTDMPDTSYARDLKVLAERGDMSQMSFGFRVDSENGDEWNWDASPPERRLTDVELFDVSSVTFPAYPQTSGEVRDLLSEHEHVAEERAGAVLSAANKQQIKDAHAALQAVLDAAGISDISEIDLEGSDEEVPAEPEVVESHSARLDIEKRRLALIELEADAV